MQVHGAKPWNIAIFEYYSDICEKMSKQAWPRHVEINQAESHAESALPQHTAPMRILMHSQASEQGLCIMYNLSFQAVT